jgi:hypothetical protein
MNEAVTITPAIQWIISNGFNAVVVSGLIALAFAIVYFISTILPGGKNEIRRGNR